MHVILEQHEIEQIAANLQDTGAFDAHHKEATEVAEAIALLIQGRLDGLADPWELTHLLGRSELSRAISKLPDAPDQTEELAIADAEEEWGTAA